MKLIVGLGNPGKEYENTRHNVGFLTIDKISEALKISLNKEDFKGVYGKGKINDEEVILFKPYTYMNLSGEAVILIMNFFKIKIEDIVVICDDLNLDLGVLRLRQKGSHGGHNGLKNIILNLGNENFKRIRIGIGKPKFDIINFVLSKFSNDEMKIMNEAFNKGKDSVIFYLENNFDKAMSKFN